ncbi:hypothetical protein OG985_45845 [Streptomyces sp. NBC_00289]
MRHIRQLQQRHDACTEGDQPGGGPQQGGVDEALGEVGAVQVGRAGRDPQTGNVLVDELIDGQCVHAGSVLGWRPHTVGIRGACDVPAVAADLQHPVLGDDQPRIGKLEDLRYRELDRLGVLGARVSRQPPHAAGRCSMTASGSATGDRLQIRALGVFRLKFINARGSSYDTWRLVRATNRPTRRSSAGHTRT